MPNDEIWQEIENFFRWYQKVYGPRITGEFDLLPGNEWRCLNSERLQPQEHKVETTLQDSPELQEFYLQIRDCRKCALHKTRKNFVFGSGNPCARVIFVGEAPGREEDEQGLPFVGAAGRLLERMMQAIGLRRDEVYIANVLKCRPPMNRDPRPEEVEQCEPYLKRQLQIIQPQIIVALGLYAAQTLLRSNDTLTRMRQTLQKYEGIPVIVTYHPAALLRNPGWKKNAWMDLKRLRKLLQELASKS